MAQEWLITGDLILGLLLSVGLMAAASGLALPGPEVRRAIRRNRRFRVQEMALAEVTHALRAEFPRGLPALPPPPVRPPVAGSAIPPVYLYHGTSRADLRSILQNGLEGRTAGWAFTSPNLATAEAYARSADGEGIVLRIWGQRAYQNGVYFETREPHLVARHIHPGFIDLAWSLTRGARRPPQ